MTRRRRETSVNPVARNVNSVAVMLHVRVTLRAKAVTLLARAVRRAATNVVAMLVVVERLPVVEETINDN